MMIYKRVFRDGSPFAFLVIKDGVTTLPEEIIKLAISMVHEKLGDTANFKRALILLCRDSAEK